MGSEVTEAPSVLLLGHGKRVKHRSGLRRNVMLSVGVGCLFFALFILYICVLFTWKKRQKKGVHQEDDKGRPEEKDDLPFVELVPSMEISVTSPLQRKVSQRERQGGLSDSFSSSVLE